MSFGEGSEPVRSRDRDSDAAGIHTPAGRDARRRMERFIRDMAPRGTPRAYPNTQLRELNRHRRSERQFAPYE